VWEAKYHVGEHVVEEATTAAGSKERQEGIRVLISASRIHPQ
jgi:hypothetical protein